MACLSILTRACGIQHALTELSSQPTIKPHSRLWPACVGHPCLPRSAYLECAVLQDLGEESVKGLRFERIGKNRYYNVVFHMGNSYVPVSEETLEELKAQSLLPVERFLDFLIDRVGYSSYLKEQIRAELKASGDPVTQITVLQGAIREL